MAMAIARRRNMYSTAKLQRNLEGARELHYFWLGHGCGVNEEEEEEGEEEEGV